MNVIGVVGFESGCNRSKNRFFLVVIIKAPKTVKTVFF